MNIDDIRSKFRHRLTEIDESFMHKLDYAYESGLDIYNLLLEAKKLLSECDTRQAAHSCIRIGFPDANKPFCVSIDKNGKEVITWICR